MKQQPGHTDVRMTVSALGAASLLNHTFIKDQCGQVLFVLKLKLYFTLPRFRGLNDCFCFLLFVKSSLSGGNQSKKQTKLRVCQKCGWKRHWLTTAAAALHCFVSTSSLFHSVTGRRRGCDNKKCVLELVFLSVSMAKATHLSVISKNTYFTQPNKPQSGSRTLLSDSVQTLLRCRETSGQRELGSLIYASDSPLK